MPELCQRESRACAPQPRHPRHPPCGDVGTSLGWQPLGEGVHAGEVERVRRLAGLLHRPALRLVSVFELLRGRAHGLAPPAAPRAPAAEGPAPRGWDSSPSPPAGGWGRSSGTCPAPWGRCCCQTCSKPSRSASSGDRAQPVTAWPPGSPRVPTSALPCQAWGHPCHSPRHTWHGRVTAARSTVTSSRPGTCGSTAEGRDGQEDLGRQSCRAPAGCVPGEGDVQPDSRGSPGSGSSAAAVSSSCRTSAPG